MPIENENLMDEIPVRRNLNGLKIKGWVGVDRIPLKVLNDGAEVLTKPITAPNIGEAGSRLKIRRRGKYLKSIT